MAAHEFCRFELHVALTYPWLSSDTCYAVLYGGGGGEGAEEVEESGVERFFLRLHGGVRGEREWIGTAYDDGGDESVRWVESRRFGVERCAHDVTPVSTMFSATLRRPAR